MARAQAELAKRAAENIIRSYRPYGKQIEFHAAGLNYRERLLRAGNQVGKCVTKATLIDTPYGRRSVAEIVEANQPFEVLAWEGERPVRAWASKPFRKEGLHHCYRLTMANGQWVEAADYHRILCAEGWRSVCELLPGFGLVPLQSIEECARIVHGEDGPYWSGIASDYRDGYSLDCRPRDERLLRASDTVQERFPSQADARPHSHSGFGWGANPPGYTNIGQAYIDPHATEDGPLTREVLTAEFAGPSVCTLARSSSDLLLDVPLLRVGSTIDPQSWFGLRFSCRQETQPSPSPITPVAGNHIVSCEYIGSLPVYDFTVYGWHNYLAGGLVHHNTYSGAAEAAYHATGEYPDWWRGRVIRKPNTAWIGAPSGELVRDGPQTKLLGAPDEWGTGLIPRSAILDVQKASGVKNLVDTVIVQHRTGISRIKFKTYDQGRQRWQSATLDWVWFDEEPPEDIYTEGLSRTNATGGFVFMTFTPLLGMSNVVRRFLSEQSADRHDTNMTIEDAEHIPTDERAKIIASYPPHEREARTKGVPILGSGRIFPVAEELIAIDPFRIPEHWPVIGGLDFGWDHPTAAVRLAWDRDADCVYVTHAYRRAEAVPTLHIAALKPWGGDLRFAWPRDGLQHDKGSGDKLAAIYRDGGLKTLAEWAQYEGDRGDGVEAGLMDMLERMESGRWRVFRHLTEWFEEFRLYHRKDGKVVKERDDLMAASRYGLMALRFARTVEKKAPAFKPYTRERYGLAPAGGAWMG